MRIKPIVGTAGPMILVMSLAVLAHAQSAAPPEYQPQGTVRDYFLGAWRLVSTEYKYADGHTTPYPETGPDGLGFLLYAPSGRMCAQLMKPGRKQWADERNATQTEAVEAVAGFLSYCGKFEVQESERTMIHLPETSLTPAWVGTTQKRPYHLVSPNRFFFRGEGKLKQADGIEAPVVWTITWERLN